MYVTSLIIGRLRYKRGLCCGFPRLGLPTERVESLVVCKIPGPQPSLDCLRFVEETRLNAETCGIIVWEGGWFRVKSA